jgi:hypothetical protein
MNFFTNFALRALLPVLLGGIFLYGGSMEGSSVVYTKQGLLSGTSTRAVAMLPATTSTALSPQKIEQIVTHLDTPVPLKAAYMTSCIASGKNLRAALTRHVEKTELNALVIDIKDFSGNVSVDLGDPRFVLNTKGCNIPDIKEYIAELHEKNIYVVGRVTVMQDSVFTKSHPDAAVKRKSDGATWKDKKGLAFVDPGATEYWQYMIDLGRASYALGFDEINYDYIRYPSDGDMSNAKFTRSGSSTKAAIMKKFYKTLAKGMNESHIPISADLFGMTATNYDDLGIGQVLEDALLYFDYVAPMVYPSHYPPNFNGWKDPNLVPYGIIHFSMSKAVERANMLEQKESGWTPPVMSTSTASTTVSLPAKFIPKGIYAKKLRPWIQDFSYGKVYTEADVRAQKKAVYDSGLTSWMAWDPKNLYTKSAYDTEIASHITISPESVAP